MLDYVNGGDSRNVDQIINSKIISIFFTNSLFTSLTDDDSYCHFAYSYDPFFLDHPLKCFDMEGSTLPPIFSTLSVEGPCGLPAFLFTHIDVWGETRSKGNEQLKFGDL